VIDGEADLRDNGFGSGDSGLAGILGNVHFGFGGEQAGKSVPVLGIEISAVARLYQPDFL